MEIVPPMPRSLMPLTGVSCWMNRFLTPEIVAEVQESTPIGMKLVSNVVLQAWRKVAFCDLMVSSVVR